MKPRTPSASGGSGHEAALAQYRQRAGRYDLELMAFEPIRRRAIERLALRPGQSVLDVGCGTGLSLGPLRAGVGPSGRIVGIEQSPEMLEQARRRAAAQAWRPPAKRRSEADPAAGTTTLLCSPAEEAPLTGHADAALFFFVHDIVRSRAALDHVLRHLAPGARVVAAGLQWAPPWALPVNAFVWGAALYSVTSLEGLRQPWSLLAERLVDLRVADDLMLGGVYLAEGRMPGPARHAR